MPQPGSSEAVATMNGRQMPNGKATPLATQNGDNKGQSANGDGNFREMSRTRPPVIEEDLWEMARRKRVNEVLAAADFRTELEQVVRHDFAQSVPEGLSVLQHHQQGSNNGGVSSFLPRFHQLPALPTLNVNQVLNTPPIPIADLSPSVGAHQYSLEERRSRNRLATLYRLVDLFQWSQGIYNHITLRLPGIDPPHILINPFGLLYHEVTSSSLIKLTLAGDVLDQGSTNLGVNQAAYVLHSAIHEARPDVHCVVHLHTAVVTAVGSMRCGLLPICQEAMIIGPVAYHDYQGILTDEDEKRSIVQDLGDKNVMILRNHGFVACGQSVEDALHLAFHTVIACETQIRAARAGIDNLFVPSEEAALKAYATARKGGGGVNRVQQSGESGKQTSQPSTPAWAIGELEFEAWCRVLDTAGFQTGHVYRNVQLRPSAGLPKSHHSMFNLASSVATPPNGPSSVGAVDESEAAAAWRLSMLRKEQERARWLNSPTHYERVQLLETGTAHPRLVTRWVDQNCVSATSCGTPVKIHSPHQFSPCGGPADGRGEFHDRQRRLKEVRMRGSISAGPKSQLLDGLTRDDVAMGKGSCGDLRGGGHRPLYIGTASRGIIQRDQQINARVYRQLYAPNPFSGQSEEDLKQYLKEVKEDSSRPGPKSTGNGTASSAPNSPPTAPKAEPESPNSDTASLMQAVKRVRMKNGGSGVRNGRSASGDGGIPQEQRSRTNGNGVGGGADGKSKCLSAEKEVDPTGEKKQKKRRIFFSFGRKKSG